jgi:hypothetical protein
MDATELDQSLRDSLWRSSILLERSAEQLLKLAGTESPISTNSVGTLTETVRVLASQMATLKMENS